MKRLVDFYLKYQDCTSRREWKCWPFHKIYNQYKENDKGTLTYKGDSIVEFE